jgi:hypothetical protein
MLKILAVLFAFLALGATLAAGWNPLPLRPGWVGGAVLIGAALWARRHWQAAARTGRDPAAAERRTWLYMSGTALICGFVSVVLMLPGSEVHTGTGSTGGYDSWTMLGCAIAAWWIARDPHGARDERDRAIDEAAQRAGYNSLVALLLVFLLALGFAPKPVMARFTHWLIANTLLDLIMLACLVQFVAQLTAYWRSARELDARP